MKKILYSIAALLTIGMAACTSFDDPVTEDYGDGPEILSQVAAVADSSATILLTVDTVNTNYFGFALFEGDDNDPDPSQLLKATAGGMSQMLNVSFLKEAGISKLPISFPLEPNSTYQFFAVAASQMGIIGEVTSQIIKTSDNTTPILTQVLPGDYGVRLAFSENMFLGEGAVRMQYLKPYGDLESDIEDIDPESINISIAGNVVSISSEAIPAGAYALVSWETGAFVDQVNHPCNAMISEYDPEIEDFKGIFIQTPNVPFKITPSVMTVLPSGKTIEDLESFVAELKFNFDIYQYYDEEGEVLEEFGRVTYFDKGYEKSYDVTDFVVMDSSILFTLPAAPTLEDAIGFEINENLICDVYGNPNQKYSLMNAWTFVGDRDYRDDITGDWQLIYYRYFEEGFVGENVTIVPMDGCKDSVLVCGLYDTESVMVAAYDGLKGILTIPSYQYLGECEMEGYVFDVVFTAGDNSGNPADELNLKFNAAEGSFEFLGGSAFPFIYFLAYEGELYDYYDVCYGEAPYSFVKK